MSSSNGTLQLRVEGQAEIRVYDSQFRTVARGLGELTVELPAGLYRVEYRAGTQVHRELAELAPGAVYTNSPLDLHPVTAAPIPGTPGHVDAHQAALQAFLDAAAPAPGGTEIVVFSRCLPAPNRTAPPAAQPGFELLNTMFSPVPPARAADHGGDGWRAAVFHVAPGGYALRSPRGVGVRSSLPSTPTTIEQAVWAYPGWRTLVFIPTDEAGAAEGTSIYLARPHEPFDLSGDRRELALALELALTGLASGRVLVPRSHLRRMLSEKLDNPMFGLVAAHCMLHNANAAWGGTRRCNATVSSSDNDLFGNVIQHLKTLIGDVPDVRALELMTAPHAAAVEPIAWPPMMAAGYSAFLAADAEREGAALADESPAEQIACRLVRCGPWTAWRSESRRARRDSRRALASMLPDHLQTLAAKAYHHAPGWITSLAEPHEADDAEARLRGYLGQVARIVDVEDPKTFLRDLDLRDVSLNTNLPFTTVRKLVHKLQSE